MKLVNILYVYFFLLLTTQEIILICKDHINISCISSFFMS